MAQASDDIELTLDFSTDDPRFDRHGRIWVWKCMICGKWALNGLELEMQYHFGDSFYLTDDDLNYWVRCCNCKKKYHAKCWGLDEYFTCCK
jgi:hypothetical protein